MVCGALAIVLVRTVVGAVVQAAGRRRVQRRLASGPSTLEDRALVTLSGTVRAQGEPLVAPVSGRPCVLYEVHASLRVRKHALSSRVEEVEKLVARTMTPFFLDTADGRVLVEGDCADTSFAPSPVIPRDLDREIEFLRALGKERELASMSIFEELVVEPGARVAVQGMAIVETRHDDAGERGYRDAAALVRITAHPEHPLTIGSPRRR